MCDCSNATPCCGMAMTFNNKWANAPVLFDSWAPRNGGELAGSIIAIFFVACLFRIMTISVGHQKPGFWKAVTVTSTAGVGYLIMLITMTYLVPYFLTVLVGIFVGEWLSSALWANRPHGKVEESHCGC